MSTVHPVLTDDVLKDALEDRAVGQHTPGDLVRDVMATVDTMPQRRRFGLQLTGPRLLPVVLAAALPLAALIGAALLPGGRQVVPITGAAPIVFVQARYTCGDAPCGLPAEESDDGSARISGLHADLPRIVTIDPDGDGSTPLTDVPGSLNRPTGWSNDDPRSNWLVGPAVRWSPDGTRLAFRLFNDAPGIYIVDGGGLTRIVDLPEDALTGMAFSAALAWSPDGRRIAYTYPYGGVESPLYLVDTSDGRVTPLGTTATRTLAWSPDGTRIAFARTSGIGPNFITTLSVIDADGARETRLKAAEAHNYHLGSIAWSPDGTRLAFARFGDSRSPRPNQRGLYTIDADGTGLLRLTWPREAQVASIEIPRRDVVDPPAGCCNHLASDGGLAWSPDGSRVAAVDEGILVAESDGSGERRFGQITAYDVDWSPDGSRLVYAAGPPWTRGFDQPLEVPTDDWSSIYVINADGTGDRWLADGEYPDWSSAVAR